MSSYFKYFPITFYTFGNESIPTITRDISPYIDILEDAKDSMEYYQSYHIQEFDRPDIISQKIYGTDKYHWTIYYANDTLREQGWPIPSSKIEDHVKDNFKNRVIRYDTRIVDGEYVDPNAEFIEKYLLPGTEFRGVSFNGKPAVDGKVLKRDMSLGQVTIQLYDNGNISQELDGVYNIRYPYNFDNNTYSHEVAVYSDVEEYYAIHHYENADGETDVFNARNYSAHLRTGDKMGTNVITLDNGEKLYPVNILEHYKRENDKLREIKLIKSSNIEQFVTEYKKLLQR